MGIALIGCNKKLKWSFPLVASALGVLISAAAIAWHGSTTAKWSYFASLVLFLGYLASYRSSVYTSLAHGTYTTLLGLFHTFIYPKKTVYEHPKKKLKYGEWMLAISIPLLLIIIFISFYSNVNPVFDKWIYTLVDELSYIDFL